MGLGKQEKEVAWGRYIHDAEFEKATWVPGRGSRNGDAAFVGIFTDMMKMAEAWE